MQDAVDLEIDSDPQPRLGWKTIAVVLGFYAACVMIAPYPRVLSLTTTCCPIAATRFSTSQSSKCWYKTCLLEGRSRLALASEIFNIPPWRIAWATLHPAASPGSFCISPSRSSVQTIYYVM